MTAICHSQLEKIGHNWHLAGKQLIGIWLHEAVRERVVFEKLKPDNRNPFRIRVCKL